MIANKSLPTIDQLITSENWQLARARIKEQLKKDPESHWLLTQLGVTYYEERRYAIALRYILKSLPLQPDCPLTLWNLAGCLDALGRHHEALHIFADLVQVVPNPKRESCWESKAWAASLQADCLYRIGICYSNLGNDENAREFYESYLQFLDRGIKGMYSRREVAAKLKKLRLTNIPPRLNRRIKSILRSETKQPLSHSAEFGAV